MIGFTTFVLYNPMEYFVTKLFFVILNSSFFPG